VRQHCAQCLTEVFTRGYDAPTGETLCGPCYSALWGPRTNGNRLATNGNGSRPRSLKRGRPVWISGPSRELDAAAPGRRAAAGTADLSLVGDSTGESSALLP
jgi:hypothetical protein